MATIAVQLDQYAGVSGTYVLFLFNAGAAVNAGGDTLAEVSNGYFTATVSESLTSSTEYQAKIMYNGVLIYTGNLLLDRSDIINASDFSTARSVDYPSVNDVRAGVTYDSGNMVGTLVLPAANTVLSGTSYGALGTEFTGTLVVGLTVPAEGDVRFGISYGAFVGNLELPVPAQVQDGVGYGSLGVEFEGTLEEFTGGVGVVLAPVLASGQLRTPLFIGDTFTAELGTAFEWTVSPQTGMIIGNTTATFYGKTKCPAGTVTAWSATATPVLDSGNWKITIELDELVTALINADDYEWWLTLTEDGDTVTVEFGEVTWASR